ncbi:MAG TPA: hypothetical protein VG222_13970 [Vicinamibacterales bacterium]|jgi:hypothetical protein|nr:hypothetical protein [Vicinamibacterales bacterium]
MARSVLIVLLAGLVITHPARAQSKPDFSGTWTMDEARSESAHYPDFVGPVTVVITQTLTELTVETRRGDKSSSVSYRIVDAPRGQTATPAEASVGPPFDSYWNGSSLVSETVQDVPYTVRSKEVRTLSDDGREMTVETTLIVEHGYTLPGTKNYGTGMDHYRKRP